MRLHGPVERGRRLDLHLDQRRARLGEGLDEQLRVARPSGAPRWAAPSTLRTASTTPGPNVRLGTKCPSITSTWMRSAPAASASFTCSPSRVSVGGQDRGNDLDLRSLARRGPVDQPSCARNHPRWHLAAFRHRHRLGLARARREDDHLARASQRRQRERHALGRRLGRVADARPPSPWPRARGGRETARRCGRPPRLPASPRPAAPAPPTIAAYSSAPSSGPSSAGMRCTVAGATRPAATRGPSGSCCPDGPAARSARRRTGPSPSPTPRPARQQLVAALRRRAAREHQRPRALAAAPRRSRPPRLAPRPPACRGR